MALPTRKDAAYIKRKLRLFYKTNTTNPNYPVEIKEFNRAILRLISFYQLPIPKIVWCERIGFMGETNRTLGQCTADGKINLLTPNKHQYGGFEGWLNTVYHEVGHYVLWADCERKAREFAKRMCDR